MKKILIAALAILYFASTVNASTVLFKHYRDEKRKSYRSFNQLYLDGAKGGLIAYNLLLKERHLKSNFCLPTNLALKVEQAENIMFRHAAKMSDPDDTCCRPRMIGHGQGFPRAAMNSRGERYPRALCG
jgi:hypothetical protein